MLSGLLSNIEPAFSEDKKKPLPESETKQILEQLENSESLIDSGNGYWDKYDAFFENLAETAKTYYIPPEIIYKLEEAATFHVDDQLQSQMRQYRKKKQQERSETIKKYKDRPDLFLEEVVEKMLDTFMRHKMFIPEHLIQTNPLRELFVSLSEEFLVPDLDSYQLEHERFFSQYIELFFGNNIIEEEIKFQMDPTKSTYKQHQRGEAVGVLVQIALRQALPSDVIIRMSKILIEPSVVWLQSRPFFIGIVLHAKPTDTIPLEVIQNLNYVLEDTYEEEIRLLALEALLKLADRQLDDIPAKSVSILKNIKTSHPATKKEHQLADRILNKMGCKVPFS